MPTIAKSRPDPHLSKSPKVAAAPAAVSTPVIVPGH
jgi:hypothetical protein